MPEENSERAATGRGRPFQKGESGNPQGRPKGVPNRVTRDIREMAQALTLGDPKYASRLQRQLRAGTCHPTIEAKLLEYGYGRPVERIESVTFDLAAMLERIEQQEKFGSPGRHPRDPRPPLVLDAPAQSVSENPDSTRGDESELADQITLPGQVRHPAARIVQRSAQAVQQPQGADAKRAAGPRPALTPWGCEPPGCARPL